MLFFTLRWRVSKVNAFNAFLLVCRYFENQLRILSPPHKWWSVTQSLPPLPRKKLVFVLFWYIFPKPLSSSFNPTHYLSTHRSLQFLQLVHTFRTTSASNTIRSYNTKKYKIQCFLVHLSRTRNAVTGIRTGLLGLQGHLYKIECICRKMMIRWSISLSMLSVGKYEIPRKVLSERLHTSL